MEVFGTTLDMQTVNASTLVTHLSRYYCGGKPKEKPNDDEQLYHKNSLLDIRAALNRHLADIRKDVNIGA